MVKLTPFGKLNQQADDLLSKAFIANTLFGVTMKANAGEAPKPKPKKESKGDKTDSAPKPEGVTATPAPSPADTSKGKGLSLWNKFKLNRGEKETDGITKNSQFHAGYDGGKFNASVDISTDKSTIKFAGDTKPHP